MVSRPTSDTDKFSRKVFRRYPLLGDYMLSDSAFNKVFDAAKKTIDTYIINKENGYPQEDLSFTDHEIITLAVINLAKKWNSNEESKFSRYIGIQFGYRDDNGKIWSLITKSLDKALTFNNKLFIKRNGDREFYETIMTHSFGPERAWYPLLDLLFRFYSENLDWNYVPNDPLFGHLVSVLQRYFNKSTLSTDEYQIASRSYCFRVGPRRITQECPVYCAKLFEEIIQRMHQHVTHKTSESKRYVMSIVDQWFIEKLSQADKETANFSKTSNTVSADVALDYRSITPKYFLNREKLYLSLPAIRLLDDGDGKATIDLYISDRFIASYDLDIQGNELGETIKHKRIEIGRDLIPDDGINLRVVISRGTDQIYDSGNKLYRQIIVFSDDKEVSINKLRKERYSVFSAYPSKLSVKNADLVQLPSGIVDLSLREQYELLYDGNTLAMDIDNIMGFRIVQPQLITGVRFERDGYSFSLLRNNPLLQLYISKQSELKQYQIKINDTIKPLYEFFDSFAENRAVIPLGQYADPTVDISVFDLANQKCIYQTHFIRIEGFSFTFNRKSYLSDEDIRSLQLCVKLNSEERSLVVGQDRYTIQTPYLDGVLSFDVPYIDCEFCNIGDLIFNEYISKDSINYDSSLLFRNNTGDKFSVLIGDVYYESPKAIKLYPDKNRYNASSKEQCVDIRIMQNERSVTIGKIVYGDLFVQPPTFVYANNTLSWDGGTSFIGDRSSDIVVKLRNSNAEEYRFPLAFNRITVSEFHSDIDFHDDYYDWSIIRKNTEKELIHGSTYLGSINKGRFRNRTITIRRVTEDIEQPAKSIEIKPVYVDSIKYIDTCFVETEGDVFDVYEGRMYWVDYKGDKRFYSYRYTENGVIRKYKINPVKIIYINDKFLRIVNQDDEGIYCFYNRQSGLPGYEITDREPAKGEKHYKDILFYLFETDKPLISSAKVNKDKQTSKVVSPQVSKHEEKSSKPQEAFEGINSNVKNDSLRSLKPVQQQDIIRADVKKRIVVNAGPGTGKTWTLIEKIIYLVNDLGVDPETIQVLCFSRAAVEVVRNRIKTAIREGRADMVINYVDVRSFDSFASQLLYWVKDSDYSEISKTFTIEELNYDQRIDKFNSVIRKAPDLISQCRHLIVDEVQDLVLNRAEMVINLIRLIPAECGVTLLGDACQSIYDYQTKPGIMDSEWFYNTLSKMNSFEFCSFEKNYRQTSQLAKIVDQYRKAILRYHIDSCNHYLDVVSAQLPDFDVPRIKDVSAASFNRLLKKGNIGILTRSNSQALSISSEFRKKNIPHTLQRRLEGSCYHAWIGLLFNSTDKKSFNEDDLALELSRINDSLLSGRISVNTKEIWGELSDFTRHTTGRISCKDLLLSINRIGKHKDLFIEERSSSITISTIHRSKGREYDSVIIVDSLISERPTESEEHRVNYVAFSRAKQQLYKIAMQNPYNSKIGERNYSWSFSNNNTRFLRSIEIGQTNDISNSSFCVFEGAQNYIRSRNYDLVGKEVYLELVGGDDSSAIYCVILKENGMKLAYSTDSFEKDVLGAIRRIKKLPHNVPVYKNLIPSRLTGLYILDVATEIGPAKGNEHGVIEHGGTIAWNTLLIEGYARTEFSI